MYSNNIELSLASFKLFAISTLMVYSFFHVCYDSLEGVKGIVADMKEAVNRKISNGKKLHCNY